MEHRFSSIDLLKAVCIVVVIEIHAFHRLGELHSTFEVVRRSMTVLVVPAFFFVAGFLSAIHPGRLARRLRRLLIPYVIATLLALAYQWLLPQTGVAPGLIFALVTGSAWGIYYFVFALVGVTVLGWLIERAPGQVRGAALVIAFLIGIAEHALANDSWLFWGLRSPLHWLSFYLVGNEVARRRQWLLARRPLVIGAMLGTVIMYSCAVAGGALSPAARIASFIGAHLAPIAVVFGLWGVAPSPVARWLSDATYPIYLYHYFFVRLIIGSLGDTSQTRAIAFCTALVGSVLLILFSRRVLGQRARYLLG